MHGDLARDICIVAGEADQNTDLAQTVSSRVVHVGHHTVRVDRGHATHAHVLANCRNLVSDEVCDSLAFDFCGFERFDVGNCHSGAGNCTHHVLEFRVLRNEVGFRVHFDSDALATVNFDGNEAFCGRTARLFRGFS